MHTFTSNPRTNEPTNLIQIPNTVNIINSIRDLDVIEDRLKQLMMRLDPNVMEPVCELDSSTQTRKDKEVDNTSVIYVLTNASEMIDEHAKRTHDLIDKISYMFFSA